MIGIDTNVLARFITRDDAVQSSAAARFLEGRCTTQNPGFVNHVVLSELAWVLDFTYGYSRSAIAEVMERLLQTSQLRLQRPNLVWSALDAFRTSKAGFADCLLGIINRSEGCVPTVTFDRAAVALPEFERL